MFTNIFKKGSSSANNTNSEVSEQKPSPGGGRRRPVAQLTDAEKSHRRSTIGPVAGVQMAAAVGIGSAAKPVEIDTQFSKLMKTSNPSPSPTPSTKSSPTPDSAAAAMSPKSSRASLSAEEKKQRRKSLLAPVDKISAMSPTTSLANLFEDKKDKLSDSLSSSTSTSTSDLMAPPKSVSREQLKARRLTSINLFKKDNLEDLSFNKLTLNTTTTTAADQKMQKHKQKQLQKQMDKEVKKAEKQGKLMETRALEILSQTLELGKSRATMPEPQTRLVVVPPTRPPRLLITV